MNPAEGGVQFETTRWSLIDDARCDDQSRRAAALDALIRRYWPPVYAYIRRKGLGPDAAEETTEAFFVHVVLSRALFNHADPERGRLRSLILAAAERFSIDLSRSDRARQRLSHRLASLEHEERLLREDHGDPETTFHRRWALAVLEEATARCEAHFRSAGKTGHWELFEARVLNPSIRAANAPALADLHAQFGFRTPSDAAAAVQVVKKRLSAMIDEVVAQTVTDPGEADAEARAIRERLV